MRNVHISILAAAVALVQACGSSGSGGNERANEGAEMSGGSGGSGGAGGVSGSGAAGTGGGAAIGGGGVGGAGGVGGTSGENPVPPGGTGGTAGTGGMMDGPMAGSGGTAGMGGTGGTGGSVATGESCLQGSGDFNEMGPYEFATTDVEIGSQGMYTIFYPQPLEESCKHPMVAWGNGTGVTGSGTYAFYNEHAASWGIVVAASHNSNVGSGEFHNAALDYLIAENENPNSMFHGKLSDAAGTSGHSQGGMGANAGAGHPNVVAEVNVQGAFGSAPQDVAFLCLTGTEDIAIEGCKTAVESTSSPANYANWEGGTHTGTATLAGFISGDQGSLQYRRLYTAWFRCFLANDQNACNMFEGGMDCPVCMDPGWAEIYSRNF